MSLNIKNERTHALVRELAELTGMSQTSAVEDAVRRRIDEIIAEKKRGSRYAAIMRISDDYRAQFTDAEWEQVKADAYRVMDEMYDDMGLPQ